jgi:hypothetical protein
MIRMVKALGTDVRLLVGSLIALSIVAVVAALGAPPPPAPLSIRSAEADGAMVLRLWLEQTGYQVRELVSSTIRPEATDVLFILDPLTSYSSAEASSVRNWVRRGHTLIVAGQPYAVNSLLSPYNVSLTYLSQGEEVLSPSGPTLTTPPVDKVRADPLYAVETRRNDLVVHLASQHKPVLVSFSEGQGTVWIVGALRPFTNRGLSDPGSARLVLNLLARVRRGAAIGFDEARHGFSDTLSLFGWLVGTAPGWGIILALALTMTYLALRGRRFGRAVPLPSDRLRREPVEYIQAMATLFRRSGQRAEILKHYRGQLRRRLAERYALDLTLDDIELVKTIVFRDPAVDEAALRGLLRRLASKQISEQGLVSAALEVDDWLRRTR